MKSHVFIMLYKGAGKTKEKTKSPRIHWKQLGDQSLNQKIDKRKGLNIYAVFHYKLYFLVNKKAQGNERLSMCGWVGGGGNVERIKKKKKKRGHLGGSMS